MRISTQHFYERSMRDVADAQARYFDAQRRVTTGKRFDRPSEDVLGTANVMTFRKARDEIAQYRENLISAKGQLAFAEGALGEASNLIRRAYELAVRGANDATGQSGRDAMLRELNEIQERLVALGNERSANGRFLFGGQTIDQPPFSVSTSGLTYSGDDKDIRVEVGPGQLLVANTPGRQLFTDAFAALESLKNNLQGGNPGAISGLDIPALQASIDAFNDARGRIGAKLQTVASLESEHGRRSDELTSRISDTEDVDIAEAITDYRLAETAYQGALAAASQSFRMSLVDFIQG